MCPIEKSPLNFYEITQHYLPNSSQLNLFNILYDSDNREYFLNIFRNYIINEDAQANLLYYLQHEIDNSDFPDTISQEYYTTPFLWWVIALFNDIKNPLEEFDEDDIQFLKILKPSYIYQLIQEIFIIGGK
jgi:hypothetical protein